MSLLHTAIGIFTISNPMSNLPIYLALASGNSRQDRAIAQSASLTFVIALLVAAWVGNGLLEFFGISRGAFQIAGGLIVVLIGLSMLRSQTPPEHPIPNPSLGHNLPLLRALFPLVFHCLPVLEH